jgi:hypothetical protein
LKKDFILLLVLLPIGALMLLVNRQISQKNETADNLFAVVTPYPTIFTKQPDGKIDDAAITPAASRNIEVLSPLTGDNVRSGFVVKGNARTYENTVNIRLLDSSGNIILETNTLANASSTGQFGPFEKEIYFNSGDSSGTIEIFQYSPTDGSETDKVAIPVAFN